MSTQDATQSRRELLINGRRVRISDLIDAGLLEPGTVLYYRQRIGEVPHQAVVTERGRLRLVDGREFDTPSAAAVAVADVTAVPGWSVWRLGEKGPVLHDLRRELLRSVADDVTSGRETSELDGKAARRFTELEEARQKAESGAPITLTVRELIGLWGMEERDRSASAQIDADLANHGLTTQPDYRAVGLDRVLRMITLPDSAGDSSPIEAAAPEGASPAEAEESVAIGLTLGNLLSDENPLVWVPPSASFEEAITAMQINDYSQVAVLANSHTLHGAVSWKSIAEARHLNAHADFSDAVDRSARNRVFDYHTRLLDVLETLRQDDFIFVRDFERKITGIVTTADVVHKYDETATPFFLIGEIDQELRQLLQSTFDEDAVRHACQSAGLKFTSFNSMSIGQYQAVLDNQTCWKLLGWPLNRKLFVARLSEIRSVRNNVMHFNPDPPKASDVDKLRNFLNLIRKYRGIV